MYAIRSYYGISETTKRRVLDAAAELGYAPRASAKALAANRSDIIAVTAPLHPDTDPTAHMAFAMEVTISARGRDFDTLLLVITSYSIHYTKLYERRHDDSRGAR